MNYGQMEELLRALIRSDMDRYKTLGDKLNDEKWPDAPRLGSATFYLAAARRFGDNPPISDIITYVSELRGRLPDDTELDPHAMELMIRLAVRDDGVTIAQLTPAQRIDTELLVIYDILSQQNLSDDELDGFFAQVRQMLDENTPAQ